MLNQ
jgi:hypothetical protein